VKKDYFDKSFGFGTWLIGADKKREFAEDVSITMPKCGFEGP